MNIPRTGAAAASVFVTLSAAAFYNSKYGSSNPKGGQVHTAGSGDGHRVVSYNLLSSHLASPAHFKWCKPEDLDVPTRLNRLQNKIQSEIKQGAIINLQEVSHTWAGPLHAQFQQKGYHMVTALHGSKFSDYMGVGIAWPSSYECLDAKIKRVSDTTTDWPKIIQKKQNGFVKWLLAPIHYIFPPGRPPFDPWDVAQWRFNQVTAVYFCFSVHVSEFRL